MLTSNKNTIYGNKRNVQKRHFHWVNRVCREIYICDGVLGLVMYSENPSQFSEIQNVSSFTSFQVFKNLLDCLVLIIIGWFIFDVDNMLTYSGYVNSRFSNSDRMHHWRIINLAGNI